MKSKPRSLAIRLFKFVIFGSVTVATALSFREGEVRFESLESKTRDGGSVYNRIKHMTSKGRDVWMMQQSHHGLDATPDRWDRLAIVVEKTSVATAATFYQLEPGELTWSETEEPPRIEKRASCFMCHSNGPRAIRPDVTSKDAPLSIAERLQILAWNLRIKSYGRVVEESRQASLDGNVPFRYKGKLENETLQVKTCLQCHNEEGIIRRGHLTRQNAVAIQFMVREGFMPPFGISLPDREKKQIEEFALGF